MVMHCFLVAQSIGSSPIVPAIGVKCYGSTWDSKSLSLGSTPSALANKGTYYE
jgi:hypothetical protein